MTTELNLHCKACDRLNDKEHRFAELLAEHGNRDDAVKGSGRKINSYEARASTAWKLLKDKNVWASFLHHRDLFSRGCVDRGQHLRDVLYGQATANAYDLFASQEPDSGAMERLESTIRDGVEVRDEDGVTSFRPATFQEKRLAAEAVVELRMLRPDEMSEATQMQAETITVDTRNGKHTVSTGRSAAQKLFANIEGMNPTTLTIRHEVDFQANLLMAALIRRNEELVEQLRHLEGSEEVVEFAQQGAQWVIAEVARGIEAGAA